jgi:Arc/MetJ family transcription regulator
VNDVTLRRADFSLSEEQEAVCATFRAALGRLEDWACALIAEHFLGMPRSRPGLAGT